MQIPIDSHRSPAPRDGGSSRVVAASAWPVVAGVLLIIIVTTLVDIALHAARIFPPIGQPMSNSLALLATSYRIVIGVFAGWLTARLAPDKPTKRALMLGYVGAVLGFIGALVTWNLGLAPHWYPIALIVLAIPQCWAGGWLYESMEKPL